VGVTDHISQMVENRQRNYDHTSTELNLSVEHKRAVLTTRQMHACRSQHRGITYSRWTTTEAMENEQS